MSNKNNNKKPQNKQAEKAPEKELEAVNLKVNQYKVRSDLGFISGKRNFFIGNKNVLIVQGGYVSKEDYNLFDEASKKVFFED